MENIIRIDNVNFLNLIHYSDISIPLNKATFISGESGAGKSTLLKILNSTINGATGYIYFNGENINNIDTIRLRKEMLLVSQSVFLFDGSIKKNFEEFYSYRNQSPPNEDTIKKYLNLCCLKMPTDFLCEKMSGGEKQRAFIAICLSFNPKVLMLDEPTSALDEKTANDFFNNIKNFCKENSITLVVISHNKTLTEKYADNIIYINKETL